MTPNCLPSKAFRALALGALLTPTAWASLDWHWSFDQPAYTVGPSDSILVRATLYNEPTSTENLTGPAVSMLFAGDFQKTFDFTFGTPGSVFGMEFLRADLAPGDSLPFVFGLLTPVGGVAPAGTHLADPAFMALNGGNWTEAINRLQVTIVPDPASPALGIVGGLAVAAISFARRRSPNRL